MKFILKLGTRGSRLALCQAEWARQRILEKFPSLAVDICAIKTSGDSAPERKPSPVETKRLFTREIEEALLAGEVDAAVHSAKDLAADMPEGLDIAAVLEREDPRDCLFSRNAQTLAGLPAGSRVGTGSLRRKQQLLRIRPDLAVEAIRGNVETRIRKVNEGLFDAVVIALAGVKRLGLESGVSEVFSENVFYPAPGQGAIAVQIRNGNRAAEDVMRAIHHVPSGIRLECERAFLAALQGGCELPCGISTELDGSLIKAAGVIYAAEGPAMVEAEIEGAAADAGCLGRGLAEKILENGGRKIMDEIHAQYGKPGNRETR